MVFRARATVLSTVHTLRKTNGFKKKVINRLLVGLCRVSWYGIHFVVDMKAPVELLAIHVELVHTIRLEGEDVFYSSWIAHIS